MQMKSFWFEWAPNATYYRYQGVSQWTIKLAVVREVMARIYPVDTDPQLVYSEGFANPLPTTPVRQWEDE